MLIPRHGLIKLFVAMFGPWHLPKMRPRACPNLCFHVFRNINSAHHQATFTKAVCHAHWSIWEKLMRDSRDIAIWWGYIWGHETNSVLVSNAVGRWRNYTYRHVIHRFWVSPCAPTILYMLFTWDDSPHFGKVSCPLVFTYTYTCQLHEMLVIRSVAMTLIWLWQCSIYPSCYTHMPHKKKLNELHWNRKTVLLLQTNRNWDFNMETIHTGIWLISR